MNTEIFEVLNKEILRLGEELNTLDPKSKEYYDVSTVLKDMHSLRAREIDFVNSEREMELKEKKLELDEIKDTDDTLHKANELAENKKNQYFRFGIDLFGIVLPPIVYTVLCDRGFKFEETGTYTSQTFRNIFSKMKPFKK